MEILIGIGIGIVAFVLGFVGALWYCFKDWKGYR